MLMTKEQIAAQRAHMQNELKKLEEQEANFEKKEKGFVELKKLETKYYEDRKAMAKKFFITDSELEQLDAPKAIFVIPYKDSLGNPKMYDWFPGKIGKAPKMVDSLKAEGLDGLMKFATEHGKEWIETESGKIALKAWFAPKKTKETA